MQGGATHPEPPYCCVLNGCAKAGAAGTARKTVPGLLRGGLFLYVLVYFTSGVVSQPWDQSLFCHFQIPLYYFDSEYGVCVL